MTEPTSALPRFIINPEESANNDTYQPTIEQSTDEKVSSQYENRSYAFSAFVDHVNSSQDSNTAQMPSKVDTLDVYCEKIGDLTEPADNNSSNGQPNANTEFSEKMGQLIDKIAHKSTEEILSAQKNITPKEESVIIEEVGDNPFDDTAFDAEEQILDVDLQSLRGSLIAEKNTESKENEQPKPLIPAIYKQPEHGNNEPPLIPMILDDRVGKYGIKTVKYGDEDLNVPNIPPLIRVNEHPKFDDNRMATGWVVVALIVSALVVVGGVGFGLTGIVHHFGGHLPSTLQWLQSGIEAVGGVLPQYGFMWGITAAGVIAAIPLGYSIAELYKRNNEPLPPPPSWPK